MISVIKAFLSITLLTKKIYLKFRYQAIGKAVLKMHASMKYYHYVVHDACKRANKSVKRWWNTTAKYAQTMSINWSVLKLNVYLVNELQYICNIKNKEMLRSSQNMVDNSFLLFYLLFLHCKIYHCKTLQNSVIQTNENNKKTLMIYKNEITQNIQYWTRINYLSKSIISKYFTQNLSCNS